VQRSSQIITANKPTSNLFYRPDALAVAQPTVTTLKGNLEIRTSCIIFHIGYFKRGYVFVCFLNEQ